MSGSATWPPTRIVGLREFIAPWKTMEMPRHRTTFRNSSVSNSMTSCPSNTTLPSYRRTFLGRSRRIAFAVEVFPEPLSPTSAIVCPGSRAKEISSTA